MPKTDILSAHRGTYVLITKSSVHRHIAIGKLGVMSLQPGWYVYVGSAFGPGGLAARVGRHLRHEKSQRWHIDYLRAHVEVVEIWLSQSDQHLEHEWAGYFLSQTQFSVPQKGFGASDCHCEAHLFSATSKPQWQIFKQNFSQYLCQRIKL